MISLINISNYKSLFAQLDTIHFPYVLHVHYLNCMVDTCLELENINAFCTLYHKLMLFTSHDAIDA